MVLCSKNKKTLLTLLASLCAGLASGCGQPDGGQSAASPDSSSDWVATWYSAVRDNASATENITYRLLIHNAIGGDAVRLRFSNRYGKEALTVRNVNIALPTTALKLPPVDAATVTPLTFGGEREASIPPGQELHTDPVAFNLPADSDVAVTFYVPNAVSNVTAKGLSLTTSWSNGNGGGDATSDVSGMSLLRPEVSWPFLAGLEVVAPGATTVVALGDSITDGAFELPNFDTRWPDLLNDRIARSELAGRRSVINAGISGNMITANRDGNLESGEAAVTRMAWDVFDQPNLSHVIVFEGINDITVGVSGADSIEGVRAIIAEAHRRGIKVIVSTITPCFANPVTFFCLTAEAERLIFNEWVLNSGEPDATIDFNAAVGTGIAPETWMPHLTVDLLHPNPLGLAVMANSIPLEVIR